jgi:hypothetical protein
LTRTLSIPASGATPGARRNIGRGIGHIEEDYDFPAWLALESASMFLHGLVADWAPGRHSVTNSFNSADERGAFSSWDHAVAGIVEQEAGQEMVGFGFGVISVRPLIGELLLNSIKKLPIHDRWLLAGQDFTLVFDLANIELVAQQIE